ncbi:MAG: ferrochelatase, partial [Chlamydiales bacterium]|nr:ferrochelatase [Chlamydiales bacterium]
MQKNPGVILVNFGGPRSLEEIEPFLIELLTDQDVVSTSFPPFLHRLLFTRIAKKRAKEIKTDYQKIGGKSPIFEDTEAIASRLRSKLPFPLITFHRYLPDTHPFFFQELKKLEGCEKIRVFPFFPQFSYTTTGSIARFFQKNLCGKLVDKLFWIKSYPTQDPFVKAFQNTIRKCLEDNSLLEEETLLLFSAHGLPQRYVLAGDPYQKECEQSFAKIAKGFPLAGHKLSYQSLFGKEVWIKPYTSQLCKTLQTPYKNVVVVPLSFTSDHIETLFEIEE